MARGMCDMCKMWNNRKHHQTIELWKSVSKKWVFKVYKKLSEKTLISHPCKHRKQRFNYSFIGIPIMAYCDKRGRFSKQISTNISNRQNRNILIEHNYSNIFNCDGDECVNTRCNAD